MPRPTTGLFSDALYSLFEQVPEGLEIVFFLRRISRFGPQVTKNGPIGTPSQAALLSLCRSQPGRAPSESPAVSGVGFMVYGSWFMGYSLWFMVYGLWLVYGQWSRDEGCGLQVEGRGLRAAGSGLKDKGSGFRVEGSGSMVQGAWFRIHR